MAATFGEWVRARRKARRWSIAKAAGALRISSDALFRIEKSRTTSPQPSTLEKVVEVFGEIPEEIDPAREPLDNNVEPAPARVIPIPEWSAEIACGLWVDCSIAELDTDTQMSVISQGRFIVRCAGDSMSPLYKPGSRVLFRIVRLDAEPLRIGADYYWQRSDGQCTLKTLKAIGEHDYTLAPRNRKYKPLRVAKQMISRIAIVETIMHAPWNGADD